MKDFFYSFGKAMRSIIAFTIVILSFTFLFLLLRVKVPAENQSIVNVASGIVLAALGVVVGYYFGSSKDKSDRDKADIKTDLVTAENTNP